MMNLTEKSAYLKGLAEGMNIDGTDNQGKLMLALLDLIDDLSMTVADLEDELAEMAEQLDSVDEDLATLEDDFYDDDDCDCDCCDCDDDDDFYEVECPACNDTIYVDEEMLLEGGIECPNCGTDLEFDLDECDDDCDCDCCCGDEE
jgi:hypothetical protein